MHNYIQIFEEFGKENKSFMTADHHILRLTFFSLRIYFILIMCGYVSLSVSALPDALELELQAVSRLLCLLEPTAARAILSLTPSRPPRPIYAREGKKYSSEKLSSLL